MKSPKVFISYSWTTPEHEQWVLELAQRLRGGDGVDITLDKWDLKHGHDKFNYMERMAGDEFEKVLLVCDATYAKKANDRKGGVGTETQIITPEIYENVGQQKFIPIIAERDPLTHEAYLPKFISSRVYIDLSSEENFEQSYEELLRCIYDAPLHKKPALGSLPKHLFEEQKVYFPTKTYIKRTEKIIYKSPELIPVLLKEFLDCFINQLPSFKISLLTSEEKHFDDTVFNSIQKMTPLRNDYIKFLELVVLHSKRLDVDVLIRFFERLFYWTHHNIETGNNRYHQLDFDNFKFLLNEIFIYTVSILLTHDKFLFLFNFLNATYFLSGVYEEDSKPSKFGSFQFHIASLEEHRNKRLNLNKINLSSDILIQRCTQKYNAELLASTDLLLDYLSKMSFSARWHSRVYFYSRKKIPLLERLVSQRHFNKVKELFGTEHPDDFKEKAKLIPTDNYTYRSVWSEKKMLTEHIDLNLICTLP